MQHFLSSNLVDSGCLSEQTGRSRQAPYVEVAVDVVGSRFGRQGEEQPPRAGGRPW